MDSVESSAGRAGDAELRALRLYLRALGDTVRLQLDMRPHYWRGERECEGMTSVYRGPVLLTFDRRLNEMDPDDVPQLRARSMRPRPVRPSGWLPTMVAVDCLGTRGERVRLCDFASAGESGSPYCSWLDVTGTRKTAFSKRNPLRSRRP